MSIIAVSTDLFLVYKYMIDFCVLVFYPAILLNQFWEMFCRDHHVIYKKTFISSQSVCSISCLITVVITWRTMLNRSGENRHTYLFLGIRGKPFSLSPLNLIALGFNRMLFFSSIDRIVFFFFFFSSLLI